MRPMTPMEIKVLRKKSKEIAWPDLQDAKEAICPRVVILEKGTAGGQPVVAFDVKTVDGHYILQLPEFLIEGIVAALKGAKQNWKENPE